MAAQYWETGRDKEGQCTVVNASPDRLEDLQVSEAGDTISVHGSKIPAYSAIMGMVATVANESSLNPPSKHFEGSYEYTKLGQTVRKPLQFVDKGIAEMAPK